MNDLRLPAAKPRRDGVEDISVLIVGEAGDGLLFTGNVLARSLKRHGWEALTYRDFPSNIRGEESSYTIRASRRAVFGRPDRVDVILAFDCARCRRFIPHIRPGGIVLCDGEEAAPCGERPPEKFSFFRFFMRRAAREAFGNELYKNMIVLGGLAFFFGLERDVVEGVIRGTARGAKGRESVEANLKAVALGYEKASALVPADKRIPIERRPDEGRILLTGDEAIGFGALAAGCRLFAAYPICPASEVWQWLVRHFPEFHGLVVQTEDELAALNLALGAALAGARAMTSTSGPGGSLMMETFSLAGMAEIPVVIAHVQRVGPATGIPTKTEQSDLTQWIYGSHGDFPRIVLAPGTLEECFEFTVRAFNLAEKYQCPVVVLTEEDMGQNLRTAPRFDVRSVSVDRGRLARAEELSGGEDFKRYAFTADGISPRSFPSQPGGRHMVEGNEHDETGRRDETEENRVRMADKRALKLRSAPAEDFVSCRLWGREEARLGLIAAGSVLGAALEAMDGLRAMGTDAKLLQLRTLWPFPAEEVGKFLGGCDEALVVENNGSGQLRSLIRSRVSPPFELGSILKYSGQAFQPLDIVRGVTGRK